jgi:hypothetical protein
LQAQGSTPNYSPRISNKQFQGLPIQFFSKNESIGITNHPFLRPTSRSHGQGSWWTNMGARNRKSGFIWTPFSIMHFTLGDLGDFWQIEIE